MTNPFIIGADKAQAVESNMFDFKPTGSNESLVGRDGHINASSKKELMNRMVTAMEAMNKGELVTDTQVTASQKAAKIEARKEALSKAYGDKNGNDWIALGSEMGSSLRTAADREGFLRKLLQKADISQGAEPRIEVNQKNVEAYLATGIGKFAPEYVRDLVLRPQEFAINSNIQIEKRSIHQSGSDILEKKYNEGLEQIMRREDVTVKRLLDATVGQTNNLQLLSGGLTSTGLARMISQLQGSNVPSDKLLIAADVVPDITGANNFSNEIDPVSKLEIIQTGTLGVLHGLTIITDGFRHTNLRVLESGEVYVLGTPTLLGGYTEREMDVEEVSGAGNGVPSKGWLFSQLISMVAHNPAAVIKGIRS